MEVQLFLRRLIHTSILAGIAGHCFGGVLFQDGFESGTLSSAWTISTTEQGRVTVSTNFAPASGQWQLILDDRVDDAIFSVAAATLQLDLLNKKNVVLSFKAKSLGNEPDYGSYDGYNYDAVSVSVNGGAYWSEVSTLPSGQTGWQTYSIRLDDSFYNIGDYGSDVRVRFCEYDNASAPLDGIAIDDVTVTADDVQRSVVEVPAQVMEGAGPYTGYVFVSVAPTNDLVLALTATAVGILDLPDFVTIPAGQIGASFSFSVPNDNVANLTRHLFLSAVAPGVEADSASVLVLDDDAPKVTLTFPPQLIEGQSTNGLITLDKPAAADYNLYITTRPSGEAYLWSSSVTIPAGQTQAGFRIYSDNDNQLQGNVPVTIVAMDYYSGDPVATNNFTLVDNDVAALSLSLPAFVTEGSAATGTLELSGSLPTNLLVNLSSSGSAQLRVPAAIIVSAGQTEAEFPIAATDNSVQDGNRTASITAQANGFSNATQTVTIRDNEVAGLVFGSLSNIVNVSSPVDITVSAANVDGNTITNFNGSVNLFVVLPDGSALTLNPANVYLFDGQWAGAVTFPPVDAAPLRLRATDNNGLSTDSPPFDIMRTMDLPAADLVWDAGRKRIYASVRGNTTNRYADNVVAIDPDTAGIVGSVAVAQDPGQLVLTSGGEYLCVARDANGTIARLNANNLTSASVITVGATPALQTLYAADMCTVPGQPDLLVVARRTAPDSGNAEGVAVYDHGLARPVKSALYTTTSIEPLADPALFFSEDSSGNTFDQLRLDSSGITNIAENSGISGGYESQMRSDGDLVFFPNGLVVNGAELKEVGMFDAYGPVLPDVAAHRVYFIEQQSSYYYWNPYDRIGAYDPTTFGNIRKLTLSTPVLSPSAFIRWGTNGLAFVSSSNVVLINSTRLVPGGAPADLRLTMNAAPDPATAGAPVVYSLSVSNQGPNVAPGTLLHVRLLDNQTIQSVSPSNATMVVSSNFVVLQAGDLTANATATLDVTTVPQSAGPLTCVASADSDAPDPDYSDNAVTKFMSVGYVLPMNVATPVRLTANNLIYDPTRSVLWVSVSDSDDPRLENSVISVNPLTGLMSEPIPLPARPLQQCMAVSDNGRFLYVGIQGDQMVCRIDLETKTNLVISIGGTPYYSATPEDIVPLAGDGTSFLVTDSAQHNGAVFDGSVARTNRTDYYTADRIAKTPDPDVFIGYNWSHLNLLSVTNSGVLVTRSADLAIGGNSIVTDGNFLLSGSGQLVDISNFLLLANFETTGVACLDMAHHRAYLADGTALHAFDTTTLLPAGDFALPHNPGYYYPYLPQACVRWAPDGFAFLDYYGNLSVLHWSSAPLSPDSDADGFLDSWEITYFGALRVNPAGDDDGDGLPNFLEYIFGTSPVEASPNPLRVYASRNGDQTVLRLVFPRLAGMLPRPYDFVISTDLANWSLASNVVENVLATQTVGGVQIETVEALISMGSAETGYVRFKWQ